MGEMGRIWYLKGEQSFSALFGCHFLPESPRVHQSGNFQTSFLLFSCLGLLYTMQRVQTLVTYLCIRLVWCSDFLYMIPGLARMLGHLKPVPWLFWGTSVSPSNLCLTSVPNSSTDNSCCPLASVTHPPLGLWVPFYFWHFNILPSWL